MYVRKIIRSDAVEREFANNKLFRLEIVFGSISPFFEFKTAIFFQTVDFYAKVCYILKASQKNNKSTLEISDYV